MLRLHHSPDTAATILRLVAREAGIALDIVSIDRRAGGLDSPAYRALNPTGTIPVLETPQGPVSETGAALLWLAETYGLGPAPGTPNRPAFLKWLFFLSNTLHADLIRMIRPWRHVDPEGEPAMITLAAARILNSLGLIEAAMRRTPELFPPLGPLSAYLVVLTRWAAQYPAEHVTWFHLDAFPGLAEHAAKAEARPAAVAIAAEEDLGHRPFTAPPRGEIPSR
ncbi:glutathione S-transferase family protein [Xinfangfangia pollutisoli]|uniref:glutathione S-transferase family protein n=1 Tax=Xinfangfangia pollutisoli TaxID=2865960 RepID=UPI001CD5855E|nr:glutathione S-transferase family protein [Xinfangfangia pollutisoli]